MSTRTAVISAAMVAALATAALPGRAEAGNLIATGHDVEGHCSSATPSSSSQCHYFKVAIDFVRSGAPNPAAPVLLLDCTATSGFPGSLARALDASHGAGVVPRTTMCPSTDVNFDATAFNTSSFSAIVTGSSCGDSLNTGSAGCQNVPDSTKINARKNDIAAFFNAGGGILALSGEENADGNAGNGPDVYYDFLPIPVGATAVAPPFKLTPEGAALGFEDNPSGNNDINCCETHNSFALPPAGGALQVAETDNQGKAETLFVRAGQIGSGGFQPPPGNNPPPPPPPKAPNPNNAVTPGQVFQLPPTRKCVSRRNFLIRLRRPPGVTFLGARVTVNGRQVRVVIARERYRNITGRALLRKRLVAQVDLRGLAKGRFNVGIRAVTKTLKVLKNTRRYRTCAGKLRGGPPRL